MNYRNLGKSGLKVSEISLGSYMTFGQRGGRESAKACIDAAFDCGINSFDTADVYGKHYGVTGSAEALLGELLKDHPRSSYVLATKAGYDVFDGPNGGGLSRKHLIEACEASLKRLRMDYIDIYYMHLFSDSTPVEETMDALDTLVRQGKVLYTGISNWPCVEICKAQSYAKERHQTALSVVQPPYNMFDRKIEQNLLPLCKETGLGLATYFPLAQGVLAGRYNSVTELPKDSRAADRAAGKVIQFVGVLTESNLEKVRKMTLLAQEIGLEMSQLALAWILRHAEISTVLTGASKPEQVRANAKAAGTQLSPSLLAQIEKILAD